MKNQTKKITVRVKNVMMAVVLVTLSVINTSAAMASEKSKNAEPLPIEVKSLGKSGSQPLLQVNIANENAEEGKLVLIDEEGDVLYTDYFQTKGYSKTFQINTGVDLNGMKLKVILSYKNNKKAQEFQISNETKTIEKIIVSQL